MVASDCDVCVKAKKRVVCGWMAALFVVAALSAIGGQAWADDWSVETGDDREQRIVERYRTMLEENPVEGMALERLLGHVGRGAGLDQLIADYERRVEERPEAHNLRLVLGHLLKARGDNEEAFEQYDRAVQIDRQDSLGWLSRGTVRLLMGERRAAMEDFEEALSREGDDERRREILRELGELSFSEREFDRGVEFFEQLVQESPRDQFLRMEYASLLVQYRQLEEAIEQYKALRRLVADDPRQKATLLRDKADVYEMKGDTDSALAVYEEVKGLVRADSWVAREVRQRIVDVYRQGGRLEEFLADYGTRWQRGDTEQRMAVADVHAELGRLEEALEQYQALARRSPHSVEPREKIIRVLERLGREEELAAAYRGLMEAAPDNAQYAFELADHYMQIGDRDGARDVLQQVERSFSGRSYVLLELADHYARWNFTDRARELYEQVLAREPDDDAVLIDVGDFYFDRGDRQRAMEVWENLPQSQLGHAEGSRRLGEVLVERGVMSEGIATFERLIEESPEDERLLRSMARALERARQWDDAIQRWEELLAVSDDATRKREARARVVELYERTQRLRAKLRDWEQDFDGGDDEVAVEAGFFVAEARLRLDELEEARSVLRSLDADHELSREERTSLLLTLERIHLRAERYEEAIDVLAELVEHDPAMAPEVLDRKTAHALAGRDSGRAVEYASRATEANPNDAGAQEKLGDVFLEIGDREAALRHYRTATDIDPRAHDAYLKLGEILIDKGRIPEAEQALMKVIEDATDTQLIRDAGAKMLAMAEDEQRLDALEVQWTPLIFRMPIHEAHARLMFDLYDLIVGPLLMTLYHGGAEEREQARERLYELGGRAAPLLVEQLQQDSTAVRIRVLRMVAEMEVDLAAPQVARLMSDEDERLRAMAIVTAARLGGERFVEPLEDSLGDGSPTVRHLAIWALGFVDHERAKEVLRDIADTDVEGTDSLMATLGLWGAEDAQSQRVVADRLRRLADDPAGGDRDRAAVLLAVAATGVAIGGGEPYRDVVMELATNSVGRMGDWSARVLGMYNDVDAATRLWAMVLGEKADIARRGERGLVEMTASELQLERRWDEEIRHFDWAEGEFDAEGLLRAASRRWTESTAEYGSGQGWDEDIEQGLQTVLEAEGEDTDLEAAMARITDQLRGDRPVVWWHNEEMRRVTEAVVGAPQFSELPESTRLGIELLARGTEEAAGTASGLDDEELVAVMRAFAVSGAGLEDEVGQELFAEALQRPESRVRRQALRNLELIDGRGPVDEDLARQIVDALQDEDRSVQLAAVRAAGHFRLDSAQQILDALEEEAPPALRRAVRQTRRLLEEN